MTSRASTFVARALLAGLATVLPACGAAPADAGDVAASAPSTHKLVELFSWWTAPGEAEALQALIETHRQQHPDARMFNAAAASGSNAQAILDERLKEREPPELFQKNVHDIPTFLEKNPGSLEPLDGIFDALKLRETVFPEVVRDVTTDGHIYSMPVNLHRENALFYNKKVFARHGITPPTTYPDFLEVCAKLKAAGVTPIATSFQGWILRIMFNTVAMGKMGAERYRQYFLGQIPPDDLAFRGAIEDYGLVLREYVNVDAGEEGFGWTNAAQAVYNDDAAMFLHGDWVKGYFIQIGWQPGRDFGVVGAPGASELFLYGVDAFAMPRGSVNTEGARDFLKTLASPDGQVAFNRLKGSSPIRADIPRNDLDELGRATLSDLEHAKYRMLVRSRDAWDNALSQFAKDHDADALLRAYVSNPPQHESTPARRGGGRH